MTPRTLILGLGNTLMTDEAVGPIVVQRMAAEAPNEAWGESVVYLDGGTLSFTLAGPIADCQRLIVVDAAAMGATPGTVRVFEGEAMDRQLSLNAKTVHEVSLADLLDIARLTNTLPTRRALIGIEPTLVDWGSELTPAVASAVTEAVAQARGLIARWDLEAGSDPGSPALDE